MPRLRCRPHPSVPYEHMFCYEDFETTSGPAPSRLIRALDTTVAIATLETYGVVDARHRPTPRPAAETSPEPACHERRYSARRLRHAGRPRPATAAGRIRHRTAMRRVENLGR